MVSVILLSGRMRLWRTRLFAASPVGLSAAIPCAKIHHCLALGIENGNSRRLFALIARPELARERPDDKCQDADRKRQHATQQALVMATQLAK